MHGNNEIGTVNPIKELAAAAHEGGALFHTDAAQTLGKIPFDVAELGVDAASFSSHKIYGPKGIGALYLQARHPVQPHARAAARSPRSAPARRTCPAPSASRRRSRSCSRSSPTRRAPGRRCATASSTA